MSEPAAKPRQPIDLEEFERRLRAGTPTRQPSPDPLTELAQLVGENDPFQSAYSTQGTSRASRQPAAQPQPAHPPLYHDWAEQGDAFADEHPAAAADDADQHGHYGHFDEDAETRDEGPYQLPADHETYAYEDAEHEQNGSHFAHDEADHEHAADGAVFADDMTPPPAFFEADAPPRRSLRGVVLLVAILGAAAAGSWAALSMKGTMVAHSDKQPPVILAGGPTKVQPDSPGGQQPPSQAASVLDKSAVDKPAQAKVVSNEEQPVDLSQQDNGQAQTASATPAASPQAAPAAPEPTPAPPSDGATTSRAAAAMQPGGAFPEPKRVKVVSVRPDGSIIGSDADAAPSAAAPALPAATAAAPTDDAADASAPKASTRAPAAAAPAADDATSESADAPKQRADARAARAPAKAKPAQVAEADPDTTATTTAAGPFAVQLAAAPSEQDARQTLARVQKKFSSQLGHHKTTFHKVQVGDKMVYRVRVGNLSHDEATDLCNKLQSDGGSCFVASQN